MHTLLCSAPLQAVFNACLKLFAALPLAAVVAQTTLVLHGGLPRAPPRRATRRSLPSEVKVASLADIAASGKGGEDPDPAEPEQRLAADVLWSDPSSEPGIVEGSRPGGVGEQRRGGCAGCLAGLQLHVVPGLQHDCAAQRCSASHPAWLRSSCCPAGILFGPDVTAAFLRDNGLRCILRGHEGKGAARAAAAPSASPCMLLPPTDPPPLRAPVPQAPTRECCAPPCSR